MKVRLVNPNIKEDYGRNLLKCKGVEDLDKYLNPNEECLNSPFDFENIERAEQIFKKAIDENSNILLIVDCDVDGFTSAAIIYQYIKKIKKNINIHYCLHEGKKHGLEEHIDWIIEHSNEIDLIIIPDAASNDIEYCQQIKEIPCLILDHHITDNPLSENMIVVNNQLSPKYSNKDLTGAGVTWQFCRYYDNKWGFDYSKNLIDLAALGIIADMGSLLPLENRYIIKKGLENVYNYFFKTLIEKQSYSMGGEITPITVAFYVVPLINAMIRVGTMEEKERLFMAFIDGHEMVPCNKRGAKGTMEEVAIESVRECVNARSRQNKIKEQMVERLEQRIFKNDLLENKILFIILEDEDDFPTELNGLVATQLSQKYKKPTIITRLNSEGFLRGSIRGLNNSPMESFKNYLHQTLLFEYVLGHDFAAGCSIKQDNLERFIELSNENLKDMDFGENVYDVNFGRAAADKDIEDIVYDLYQYRNLYGQSIPEPLIYIHDINITKSDIQILGKNSDTVKIEKNGIAYMKFHAKEMIIELAKYDDIKLNIVGRANVNTWLGRTTPQIFIEGYEIKNGEFEF